MSHIFSIALEVKSELGEVIEEFEHRLVVIGKDLRLLSYVYIAWFIVWRQLCRTNTRKTPFEVQK